jgi:hypothetical protein
MAAADDDDRAGVAAGVLTTARHVGGAVGIAVLGAIAAAAARADWHQQLSELAPATQAKAAGLTSFVLDGQGERIGALAGRAAQQAAFESFVHGLRGALLASAGITFVAAAVALVGLRRPTLESKAIQK